MRYRAPANVLALDGRRAHAITLALHELATNAARYDAPSIQRGSFEIE
jgi:two-component sensor histidine kinase